MSSLVQDKIKTSELSKIKHKDERSNEDVKETTFIHETNLEMAEQNNDMIESTELLQVIV